MNTNNLPTQSIYQPAIDLLHARRRTNGYADIWDLCEACGIDSSDLCAEPVRRLASWLDQRRDVDKQRAALGDLAQYRVMT